MHDYFNLHEALLTHDGPYLQIGTISRRRFMVLLVAGCQARQGTAPTPTRIPASATIPVLIPSAPIAPENANRMVQLAVLEEDTIVRSVAWSPDGRMLASSRQGGLVQLWDTGTGKELTALQGHLTQVRGTAWSPDGIRIASGSDDGTIRLWGVR